MKMKYWRILGLGCALYLAGASGLWASELTFKFINPSFGGDALYGTYLLQQAQVQNKFKEEKKSLYQPKSLLERFTESFTSQLLYRMANIMLNKIFGENNQLPEGEGTYYIGNFQIYYKSPQDDPYYTFEITDLSTGQTTTIKMPSNIFNM
jgi:curli production assembly/transport component CsgF